MVRKFINPAIAIGGQHWYEYCFLCSIIRNQKTNPIRLNIMTIVSKPSLLSMENIDKTSADHLIDHVNTLKEDGFTEFFREIQGKKMKELREKFLEEIGFTEESLTKMPPE